MTRLYRQIITLAVDFDLSKVPPPEEWKWDVVGAELGATAKIEVLASGKLERKGAEVTPTLEALLSSTAKHIRLAAFDAEPFRAEQLHAIASDLEGAIYDEAFKDALIEGATKVPVKATDLLRVSEG